MLTQYKTTELIVEATAREKITKIVEAILQTHAEIYTHLRPW
jgi:hypothetical protein